MELNLIDLVMRFFLKCKEIDLRGIQEKPSKVISSNRMRKLLKKVHHHVISQLCSLDVQASIFSTLLDIQIVINNHSKVSGEIPKARPPAQDHHHDIHLQPRNVPPNIRPYMYPYAHETEIDCMIQEKLDFGIIKPRQSNFSSPVVMAMKNDGSWHMCPNYRKFNKMTIQDNFRISIIHELLYELHGSILFTKLDVHLRYHQIRMS